MLHVTFLTFVILFIFHSAHRLQTTVCRFLNNILLKKMQLYVVHE